MSTASERRAPDASRIPFDGMVEVGGALGPSFEAQAVNVSEEGMHLRTAYLPEVGQPVTCRFDAGQGMVVVAAGEVLWKDDMGDGGEFGIRFTNLDGASTAALQRIVGMVDGGDAVRPPQGRKIRLHIEGLASPMRARVRGTKGTSVTAFSELGFLQVGKQLDLEDAATGSKRAALIDRVAVDIEPETRIPQLVVTLRYDDDEAHVATNQALHGAASPRDGDPAGRSLSPHATASHAMDDDEVDCDAPHQPELDEAMTPVALGPASSGVDDDDIDEGSKKLKSTFARGAAKVTPALEKWARRAKTTVALLAARASARRSGAADDVEIPVRRKTAPAPGGGLHTSGRKVVRGEVEEPTFDEPVVKRPVLTKGRMLVGGAIGVASILAFVAMRKPAPAPVAGAASDTSAAAATSPVQPAAPPPMANPGPPSAVSDPFGVAAATFGADPLDAKPGKVTPFGNGPVGHGNVLKIKMDGPVSRIEGASQPSGFTVVIPGRRSLDAASPLASRDARIAAIRVANEPAGAELTVTFKDGVPNYQVKARGDTLELHLARAGQAGEDAPEAKATRPHRKKHH